MVTYHNYVIFTCGKIAKIAVLEVHFSGGEGCKSEFKSGPRVDPILHVPLQSHQNLSTTSATARKRSVIRKTSSTELLYYSNN